VRMRRGITPNAKAFLAPLRIAVWWVLACVAHLPPPAATRGILVLCAGLDALGALLTYGFACGFLIKRRTDTDSCAGCLSTGLVPLMALIESVVRWGLAMGNQLDSPSARAEMTARMAHVWPAYPWGYVALPALGCVLGIAYSLWLDWQRGDFMV